MTPNAKTEEIRQHGVKGVYYAGNWLDIEDCDGVFQNVEKSCSGCDFQDACPRSRSRKVAAKDDDTYDVVIIGAGCIGAAIARELSRYKISVLWVEAGDDVSQGATKGNSGIVHAGYDDKPGSNRAKYCWKGNQMFAALDKELRFGYQTNGSLVLAFKEADKKVLKDLLKRGETNGVQNLRIVERAELLRMEPHVHPDAIAALYSPDAGNVIPYEYAVALAENAVDNGVELRIRRQVMDIQNKDKGHMMVTLKYWEPEDYVRAIAQAGKATVFNFAMYAVGATTVAHFFVTKGSAHKQNEKYHLAVLCFLWILSKLVPFIFPNAATSKVDRSIPLCHLVDQASPPVGTGGGHPVSVPDMLVGGSGGPRPMQGKIVSTEKIKTKFVVNCAGGAADEIARLVGDDSFNIKPRLGDYLLLNRNQGYLAKHTLFPCPDPKLGKGVLVQTTLWGNLILGPTARDVGNEEARKMSSAAVQEYILAKCKQLVPGFDPRETFHAFCGARAKSDRGDWIIEHSKNDARMIHVAGIDSPGLAGSPAIALDVIEMLRKAGLTTETNQSFNPNRAPIVIPKVGMKGLKMGPVGKFDSDGSNMEQMAANVVCKCEKVTELEIVRAIRRSLPIDSSQGIRKRTRAGMGHCQGDPENYNCEARVRAIIARENGVPIEHVGGRPWPATSTLSQRWINEKEKQHLVDCMNVE
jgi:L-2-hydroxyglutarate oxidase LhgO